jgi:hypothetical chaperone protein
VHFPSTRDTILSAAKLLPVVAHSKPLPLLLKSPYPATMSSLSLGLDFGTTNTVVSLRRENVVTTLTFNTRHGTLDTVRTVLALWQDPSKPTSSMAVGRDALAEFSEFPEDTRLIQSLKSYAANPLFRQTKILNKPYTFAALMREFLQQLFQLSTIDLAQVTKITVGRPVKFAGYNPDEKLALERYREVFAAIGIAHVEFVHEPVAAAHAFARRLTASATVLIADFGGGTTDFSVLRLNAPTDATPHHVRGVGGIGIAGDQFDYRIVTNAILPHLGYNTTYQSMGGKILDLPKHVFNSLARWNELSFLRTTDEYEALKDLLPHSAEPEKLKRLFHIVDHSKGLGLYDAVSAVKLALSTQDHASLKFENIGGKNGIIVTRQDFESWIVEDLARIAKALSTTLDAIGCKDADIDSVFLTGGTSLVPAVRQFFATRFGNDKLHAGEELLSVAKGLSEVSG